MKAVIMQPTYLPWIGYFDLLEQADIFVIYDTVQFSKQSWQQRNNIKGGDGQKKILTVPIIRKTKGIIKDVLVDNTKGWMKQHYEIIKFAYKKAPYFDKHKDFLLNYYFSQENKLLELNMKFIFWVKDVLGLKTKIIYASEIDISGERVERLINICKHIGAAQYLSPVGAKEYIDENNIFSEHGIELKYQKFEHPVYKQINGPFISHLSIIDLLFNEGDNAINILRSGQRD